MDELRNDIWDYLFRAGEAKSLQDISQFLGRDLETITEAVRHEWFNVSDNTVTVAFHTPKQPSSPASDER